MFLVSSTKTIYFTFLIVRDYFLLVYKVRYQSSAKKINRRNGSNEKRKKPTFKNTYVLFAPGWTTHED